MPKSTKPTTRTSASKSVKSKAVKEKKVVRKRSLRPKIETIVPPSPFLASFAHGHTMYQADSVLRSHPDPRKKLTIILGVSVVMTVIVIAWILNLKHIVTPDVAASKKDSDITMEFADLKKELSTTIEDVKGKLNELDSVNQASPTATVTPDVNEIMRDTFKKSVQTEETSPTSTVTPTVTPSTLP